MNIAQVTATFPPYRAGTGTVVWHMARALSARGHQVTVFTPTTRATPPEPAGAGMYAVEPLTARMRYGNAALVKGFESRLRAFDVVHLHYPFIGGAEAMAWSARRGAYPLVLTYHNRLKAQAGIRRPLFSLYSHLMEPHILKGATILVTVNQDYRETELDRWDDVRVVPHGVDPALFVPHDRRQARQALGLRMGDRVALFVGALDEAHRFKNVDGLLRALALLETPVTLLIVGGGDRLGALRDLARSLGMDKGVIFVGPCAQDALPAIYSAADVTVLPSVDIESFGLVLIESMACGTPVVATALPGVRTVVGDGGWLVPPGDDRALSQGLEAVFSLPRAELRALGKIAGQRIRQQMTWDRVAVQMEAIYEEAMARMAGRGAK